MIKSKSDYKLYLSEDKKSLGAGSLKDYFFHKVWAFQKSLRKAEYWHNCHSTVFGRLISYWFRMQLKRKGRKLGFSIPINVFGPGLSIAHEGTIVINSRARIGSNCIIHVCVNIGSAPQDSSAAPRIGNNCYLAPGAKLYGDIVIGNNVAIGANAVVNKSFSEDNQTIAGVPAKQISRKGPIQFRSFSINEN